MPAKCDTVQEYERCTEIPGIPLVMLHSMSQCYYVVHLHAPWAPCLPLTSLKALEKAGGTAHHVCGADMPTLEICTTHMHIPRGLGDCMGPRVANHKFNALPEMPRSHCAMHNLAVTWNLNESVIWCMHLLW